METALKIILLEDNPLDVELIKLQISTHQNKEFDLKWVENKKDYIDALSNYHADVILTDYQIPDYSGLEAINDAKKLAPKTPIIVVTGTMSEETAASTINHGAWDYVVKERIFRLNNAIDKAIQIKDEKAKNYDALNELKQIKSQTSLELNLLYNTIEISPSSIVITDIDGKIEYVNQEFENITGYSKKEVLGKNPKIINSGSHDSNFYKTLWQTILSGQRWNGTFLNKKKNGELYWEKATIVPIKNRENEISNFVGVKHDITLLKKQQEEINKREKDFESLLNNPKGYAIYRFEYKDSDNSPSVTHVSPSIKNVLGIKSQDLFELNSWYAKIHDDDRPRIEIAINNSKKAPFLFDEQFRYNHPQKGTIWLHIHSTGAAKPDNPHQVDFETGIILDITNQQLLKEKLELSEDRYSQLFSSVKEGINLHKLIYNDKGQAINYKIIDCNQASESLLGINKEDAINKLATDLYKTKDAPYLDIYTKVVESGIPTSFESFFAPLNKFFKVSVFSPSKGQFATIFSDISKLKNAEKVERVLQNISQSVLTAPSLYEFLDIIRTELGTIIDVKNFLVALYNQQKDQLTLPYLKDEKDNFTQVPAKKTLAGYVIKTKKSLLADQTKILQLSKDKEIDLVGSLCKIWLGTPLIADGKAIGIIALQSYENEHSYSQADMELLNLIASQISITINRFQKQKEIEYNEKKFRYLFNNINDPIFILNRFGKIVHVNASATTTLGFSYEEFLDSSILEYDQTMSSKELEDSLDDLNKHKHHTFETNLATKSGTVIPMEVHSQLIEYDGQMASISVTRDISYRRKAEAEIRNSELKLKTILNNIQPGILIIDTESKLIVDTNPAATQLIGFTDQNKIIGHSCHDYIFRNKNYSELRLNDSITNESILLNSKQDRIPIIETVSKITLQNKDHYVISFVDISKQIELQKSLKHALEKAKESDHLKSAFLAAMSHELRTPLNAVIGFSDLMCDSTTDEEIIQMAKVINTSGNELLKIVESIFDLTLAQSKHSELKIEQVSMLEIFSAIKQVISATMINENKTHLRSIYKPNLKVGINAISTDKQKVIKILSIFANNAVKFTETGTIEFGFNIENQNLVFFVKDTGIGIPREKQDIIFDKFRQVDDSHTRKYGGLGLGLAICKELSNILNGTLRVESEVGVGSTFYFRLPHTHNQAEIQKKENSQKDTAIDLTGKTILIAEDMESNYLYLKKLLSKTNTTIIWVQNGVDAVSQVDAHPEIELVLMDIRMPVMNGLEATQKIKENKPEIKVVAQTAYAMPKDEKLALDAGCDDYISKPIRGEKLFSCLKRIFDKE